MNVLMLSTDQKIFDPRAEVYQRMISYGSLFEELHIIVYTKRGFIAETKHALAKNTFVYSTNSVLRVFYFFNAFFIARKILGVKRNEYNTWAVTSQDPFETGIVGYLLKRFFCLPLQIQIHTDFLSPYFWAESIKNKLRVLLGKWVVKHADGVRAVSERIKNQLKTKNYKLKTDPIILPVFVNIEQIRTTIITKDLHKKYPQFDFIILMVSRLTREKNIGMAIEAMFSLIRTNKRIGLIIVGEGPEKEKLKLLTTYHSLNTNVIFEPAADFETIISYYKTADCYVLTSNYEGYGRTVIEAMASGCPVITTDVGIAGDIVKDGINGRVVQINHSEELASAITSLCIDVSLRKKYTVAGYTTIATIMSKNKFFELWKTALENLNVYWRRKKLCYIMPEYRKEDATHFAHVQDFIKEITKSIDVYLIIERGIMPDDNLGAKKIYVARSHMMLLAWYIFRARITGYRDFYIHYSFRAALAASILVRWNGGRVLYWNCGEPWKFRRSFVREQFERFVYRVVTFLVTGTATMKEAYAREYNISLKKIKIIPNWINTKRFVTSAAESAALRSRLCIDKDAKVILFVHHVSKRKGADLIVPVFQELQKQSKNIVMLVIGGGPEEDTLHELIFNANLKERILLLGSIPNNQIQEYFSLADVFFMPSREEGFPRVLLEAMTMGIPFVASDVGGVRDIVPKETQQYVLDTKDPPLLARALQGILMLTYNERSKLSIILKKWVLQYNLEEVAKRFFEIIYENN